MVPGGKTGHSGRSTPTHGIARLAGELARELERFDPEPLPPAELRRLLDGLSATAAALTQFFDVLRACPTLTQADNDLVQPAHQSVESELAQAAAAAEDLMVTAGGLCRLLPRELSTVDPIMRSSANNLDLSRSHG